MNEYAQEVCEYFYNIALNNSSNHSDDYTKKG